MKQFLTQQAVFSVLFERASKNTLWNPRQLELNQSFVNCLYSGSRSTSAIHNDFEITVYFGDQAALLICSQSLSECSHHKGTEEERMKSGYLWLRLLPLNLSIIWEMIKLNHSKNWFIWINLGSWLFAFLYLRFEQAESHPKAPARGDDRDTFLWDSFGVVGI